MRISELSHLTGVSTRAIRHYEEKGLLTAERLDNNYRDFSEAAVEHIRSIQLDLMRGFNCRMERIWFLTLRSFSS